MFSRKLAIIAFSAVTIMGVTGARQGIPQLGGVGHPPQPAASTSAVSVVIAGAVSEVPWPGRAAASRPEAPCFLFFVSAPESAQSLTLTTTGIGRARLADAPGAHCPSTTARGWQQQLILPIGAGFQQRPIALRLDPETAPPEGGLLEGRILALVGDFEAGGANLKVRPEVDPPWLQSFYWFLGIAVPALIAFLVTRAAQRLDARNSFHVFRILEASRIKETIDYIQSVLNDPEITEPGRIVYEIMRDKGTLEKLTPRSRRKAMGFCYANNMGGLVKLMKRLFPREAASLRLAST